MLQGEQLAQFLEHRAGKLTASRMRAAMSFKKDGTPTKERSDLLRALLAERVTGQTVRTFVNDAMRFGLEYEDEAKAAYEAYTGEFLTPCGTFDHPRIDMLAATPDSLRGSEGVAEFKVPTSATYIEWVLAGVVPEEHKPQMCLQLACTGRKHARFIAYEPRIRNSERRLFILDYEPTAEEIAAVETAAEQFLAELEEMFQLFTERAA